MPLRIDFYHAYKAIGVPFIIRSLNSYAPDPDQVQAFYNI